MFKQFSISFTCPSKQCLCGWIVFVLAYIGLLASLLLLSVTVKSVSLLLSSVSFSVIVVIFK